MARQSSVCFFVSLLVLPLSLFGEPVKVQIYWRNDTNFQFTRDGDRLYKCFYQWVDQVIECPKNAWVTDQPSCPNMAWLHKAYINDKDKLLFTVNFGTEVPSQGCNKLLPALGLRH